MKAGFEGSGIKRTVTSNCLGPTGRDLTALLVNSSAACSCCPARPTSPARPSAWLDVPNPAGGTRPLPLHVDPFNEIYRVPAVVDPEPGKGASQNADWGLGDPALLRPTDMKSPPNDPKSHDNPLLAFKGTDAAWAGHLANLAQAESFLDDLGTDRHPETWWFNGSGLPPR